MSDLLPDELDVQGKNTIESGIRMEHEKQKMARQSMPEKVVMFAFKVS